MKEDAEQIALFFWVEKYLPYVPALRWFYHVPNGEAREKVQNPKTGKWYCPSGVKLKRMGARPGVADTCLDFPMPRPGGDPGPDGTGWYHGAKLELKRVGGDKPEGDQAAYLAHCQATGYWSGYYRGYVALWHALEDYLDLDMPFSIVPCPTPRSQRGAAALARMWALTPLTAAVAA